MSAFSPETNPQILVNGERQEKQQGTKHKISSGNLDGDKCSEDSGAAEKMQSALQQVRNQIRSQAGPKNSILELVHRVKEVEMAKVNGETEAKETGPAEASTEESKDEKKPKEEELCTIFQAKLEATEKVLRGEFEGQISQVRKEMQAYTDKALKDLECKLQRRPSHSVQGKQQESKGPDRREKLPAAASLASRRGRVLTRTMTTIIPKTCAPVIVGPRAKSETLASSKGESARLLSRNPTFSLSGNTSYQSHRPVPPASSKPHQYKKPVWGKAKS